MGKIIAATAIANNEVAQIAWRLDAAIEGCLGFDIQRIVIRDGVETERKHLPTWTPFEGQSNPDWEPQDTRIWPVQRLTWRDLTLRRRRDALSRREGGFAVRYSIRPVGDESLGGAKIGGGRGDLAFPAKTYTGPPRPLCYLGEAMLTNLANVGGATDGVEAVFTNGILSGQWLRKAFEDGHKTFSKASIEKEIADVKSPVRAYLHGDVLEMLQRLVLEAKATRGRALLALYELWDPALVPMLIANRKWVEIILSNSSGDKDDPDDDSAPTLWDFRNFPIRNQLRAAGVTVHDRFFNNTRIGHNKFAVLEKDGQALAVMTGSTNWTQTGLCGQSNNALLIRDPDIATGYRDYWQRLLGDGLAPPPAPQAPGPGAQGPAIRAANMQPVQSRAAPPMRAWFSPNTLRTTKGTATPPDLEELFALMDRAKEAIFFLAFLPSRAGLNSIIGRATDLGLAKPKLMVLGAISDVTAMPNYVAADKVKGTPATKPFAFDGQGVHIARATGLSDRLGDFDREIATVGRAIVHDKIVVIDPLREDCVVATGSHNMGFKASYANDENMLIIQGRPALARAYATHVLDVYDHYLFRARIAQAAPGPRADPHIGITPAWQPDHVTGTKGDLARYLTGVAAPVATAAPAGRSPAARRQ